MSEAYIAHPVVTGTISALRDQLTLFAELNFEGVTLRGGELTPGIFGEGYIDRRHPHTFMHELVFIARTEAGGTQMSLTAGKGFAPFGTDDPMVRPLIKYPINHHVSQLLERIVLIGAVRRGTVGAEFGLLNGDEPFGPWRMPRVERFGDSWSARVTWTPVSNVEAQVSHAHVDSPEWPVSVDWQHWKWHASVRWEEGDSGIDGWAYALLEWGRTAFGDSPLKAVYALPTLLGEAALRTYGWRLAIRFERTIRGEEERSVSIYRTPRPPLGFGIWNLTEWTGLTVNVSRAFQTAPVRGSPFVEIAGFHTKANRVGLFTPEELYGTHRIAMISAGFRVTLGPLHPRMGRYGAAASEH